MSFFYELYKRDLGDFFFVHIFKWQMYGSKTPMTFGSLFTEKKVYLFKKLNLKKVEKWNLKS